MTDDELLDDLPDLESTDLDELTDLIGDLAHAPST